MNDVTWIGSSLPEHVRLLRHLPLQHARTAWPYDASRDAGRSKVDSGGGYPSRPAVVVGWQQRPACPALAQVDPDLLTRIKRWGRLSVWERGGTTR